MINTERLLFMQIEDGMVSFEQDDGEVIIYPLYRVPYMYKEGDLIISIVHSEDYIEFIELDEDEMRSRREKQKERTARIRMRAIRSTEEN